MDVVQRDGPAATCFPTMNYSMYLLNLHQNESMERQRETDNRTRQLTMTSGPVIRWYGSLPPVTRIWLSLSLGITIMNVLEVLDDDK